MTNQKFCAWCEYHTGNGFHHHTANIPSKSLTPAKVITRDATNKSAIASDARNRFPIRRKLRSVYMARHTNILPAIDKNIKRDKKMPAKKKWESTNVMNRYFISCIVITSFPSNEMTHAKLRQTHRQSSFMRCHQKSFKCEKSKVNKK